MIFEIGLKIIYVYVLGISCISMEYLYRTLFDENGESKYDGNSNGNSNVRLVNKAFDSLGLHELFTSNNDEYNYWYLLKNEIGHICYTRRGHETDCFEVIIQKDKIYVCVPIKNSIFQYKTSFKDYSRAYDYLERRFCDFNDS
jgi:hypothetical protein